MQERQRSWSAVQDWTSCRVQTSFHALSAALEWAAIASSAMAASTRCTRNAVSSSTWQKTLTTDVHSARELHAPWMADHKRKSRLDLTSLRRGSFLLLPKRHAFSSRWLWTFNHNMCENILEEVQWSDSSSLFTPPLFQNTWPCVQLLCAKRNAPCQRDLVIDEAKPPASAAKWQGNDQTDLQCQAAGHCHHQVHWATCVAWHWGSGPHSEGEKTLMVWTCGTLQWCSQNSLWHTGWWKAPLGQLTWYLVGSIWVTCRSKKAKIIPIGNPRWPPSWKSIFRFFSWTERPIDSKLARNHQGDL